MLWSSACDGGDAATSQPNWEFEEFDSWEYLPSQPNWEQEEFDSWECLPLE